MERMLALGAVTLRRHDGLAQIDPPARPISLVIRRQEIERLRRLAPGLIAGGDIRALHDALDALPHETQSSDPWALHYRGIALRLDGADPKRAFRVQEDAREAFFLAEDWSGYAETLTELRLLAALLDQQARKRPLLFPVDAPQNEPDDPLLGVEEPIRTRLSQAIDDGRITRRGLGLLRSDYGLTPAEAGVFVAYYLPASEAPRHDATRRELSSELNLSENTLMHHITSIRRKVGFGGRRGSANLLLWCVSTGITELSSSREQRAEG